MWIPNSYNYIIWGNAVFQFLLLFTGFIAPETVVFAYFLETILIGVIHCFKLALVHFYGKESEGKFQFPPGLIGILVFFCFHYGMFVGIQSIFVFSFFQGDIPGLKDGFHLIHNYEVVLQLKGMWMVLLSLVISNLKYFYSNFYEPKQYRNYSIGSLFFKPYVRIVIQQLAVILAGFFFIVFKQGMAAAVLLIILRTIVDLAIVGIRHDSNFLDPFLRKITRTEQEFQEAKSRLESISE